MDYIELTVNLLPKNPWSEILIAQLAESGYESFIDTENGILAYAQIKDVNLENLVRETFLEDVPVDCKAYWEYKIIPQQNWNAKWEADFHSVEIEDYATILAPFHNQEDFKGLKVVIQPQMSFGTGHHQTTWMMVKALFELEEIPYKVLDMGTGTGVLAIVAEKLGAIRVLAIDIEDWSAVNAAENAKLNNCEIIECRCGDIDMVKDEKFGLILANINKNVLKSHMKSYSDALDSNGILIISGFFGSDVSELENVAGNYNLEKTKELARDEWAALQFAKTH